jgi:hypothetical protein
VSVPGVLALTTLLQDGGTLEVTTGVAVSL